MHMDNTNAWGLLLVRLAIGIPMIIHGAGKLFGIGPAALPITDLAGLLASKGLPAVSLLAWLVAIVEFGGGFLLVIGLLTRYAALAVAIDMLVATVVVHLPMGYSESELTLVFFLTALSLVVSGAGEISIEQIVFDRELNWPASTYSKI
jgi:putative oxidoreductase